MLDLTILVDNTTLTDQFYIAEPGFSLFLEAEGARILFDCGYSGVFLSNAARMQIDLWDLNYIVLSHGHLDHAGGLHEYLRMRDSALRGKIPYRIPTLVAHPWCFYSRTNESGQNFTSSLNEERVASSLPLKLSERPIFLTKHLVFLGEVPRIHAFEEVSTGRRIRLPDGTVIEDRLRDDTALAYCTDTGLVILTGCAHSGICNIISHAQEITGEDRIRDIVGGLHLIRPSVERMEKTVAFLRKTGIERMHPCHCTSFAARCTLAQHYTVEETGVGLRLTY
jgi:7,8-dihydropterin-6-yl-methyl-4-(beta-D-ribofuranosyl)aminobenzene 5'-phosphate synthase